MNSTELPGEIIILSGTSCAGKTSIAQAIQRMSKKPYLSTGHDDFLPMFPLKYVGLDKSIQPPIHVWPVPGSPLTRQGYEVIVEHAGSPPTFHLDCGEVAWRSLRGMHDAFAALALSGNNLVIADVVTKPLLIDYCRALHGLRVYLILVDCPIDELEKRERSHPNRTPGGARVQQAAVQCSDSFDLVVNSGTNSVEACAEMVLNHVASHPPRIFEELSSKHRHAEDPKFPVRIW
jgi:chloramphenicol 3-O phosphotransferase